MSDNIETPNCNGDGGGTLNESKNKSPLPIEDGIKDPNWFEVHKAEGNALVKTEKFAEALLKYDQAWNESTSDEDRAMILNNRGVVYEKTGDTQKALETFNKALDLKPEYVKVLIRRGLLYRQLKRYEDAIEDITEAHALSIKNKQTVAGLQDITSELVLDYAEHELERLTSGRQFDFPRGQFIRSYFRQFYCDPVSRIWKGLDPYPSSKSSDTPTKGFLAALDCMKTEKYSEICKHCAEEIESGGQYRLEAYLFRGSINFLAGQKDDANADFKAVYDDPNASSELKSCAYLKAALVENLWTTPDKAAEYFSSAEQLWKENADVYYHAALCLVDKGEAIPALALLEKGQEICSDPKRFPLLHVMALTIRVSYDICLSSPNEAMGKLKQLEIDGIFDTPECHEYYAQTLLLVQNCDEANIQFDKAKELSGGEKMFELKKVMAQQVLKNEPETTLATLKELENDPDIGNAALYHIGEMNLVLGNKEEAFRAIDESIRRSFSVYDSKIRIVGKIDFQYNINLTEKLKKHGVDILSDIEAKANALE